MRERIKPCLESIRISLTLGISVRSAPSIAARGMGREVWEEGGGIDGREGGGNR